MNINLLTHSYRKAGLLCGTFLLTASTLLGQDEAPPAPKNLLQEYVIDGGWTMIFIGLAMLALIALAIYNFMNLTKAKFCPEDLREQLLEHMVACRVQSAIELAASSPSYLGRMMSYALPNVDATRPEDLGRDQIEDAVADFTINENRRHMVWITYFSLIAQVAPMLGLFGTVLGMVEAFGILAVTGSADPSLLAGSISVALLTTLWGLITAIPALICYFYFKNRLNNFVAECQRVSDNALNASLQTINQEAYLAKIPEGIAV